MGLLFTAFCHILLMSAKDLLFTGTASDKHVIVHHAGKDIPNPTGAGMDFKLLFSNLSVMRLITFSVKLYYIDLTTAVRERLGRGLKNPYHFGAFNSA